MPKELKRAAGLAVSMRIGAACVMLGSAACNMPASMQVRAGVDPRSRDDDVRFRATLYVQAFEACENQEGEYRLLLSSTTADSLYRFRMTGKSNALGSEMKFESGTLQKHEIDGFYQSVDLGRVSSNGENNPDDPPDKKQVDSGAPQESTESNNAKVDEYKADVNISPLAEPTIGRGENCPDGFRKSVRFALFGPEGSKLLDKNERLVLAMSSSAKPLISSLKELADLRARPTTSTNIELLYAEENRILKLLLDLSNVDDADVLENALQGMKETGDGG